MAWTTSAAGTRGRAGQPVQHVQRILRHKSIETTLKIYGHLLVDDLRPVLEVLPAVEHTAACSRFPAVSPQPSGAQSEGPDTLAESAVASGPSVWRAVRDSNPWPSAPEADALSS